MPLDDDDFDFDQDELLFPVYQDDGSYDTSAPTLAPSRTNILFPTNLRTEGPWSSAPAVEPEPPRRKEETCPRCKGSGYDPIPGESGYDGACSECDGHGVDRAEEENNAFDDSNSGTSHWRLGPYKRTVWERLNGTPEGDEDV